MIERIEGDRETDEDHDKDFVEEGFQSFVAELEVVRGRWQGSYRSGVLYYYLRWNRIGLSLIFLMGRGQNV